jgi:hypothetical protein
VGSVGQLYSVWRCVAVELRGGHEATRVRCLRVVERELLGAVGRQRLLESRHAHEARGAVALEDLEGPLDLRRRVRRVDLARHHRHELCGVDRGRAQEVGLQREGTGGGGYSRMCGGVRVMDGRHTVKVNLPVAIRIDLGHHLVELLLRAARPATRQSTSGGAAGK